MGQFISSNWFAATLVFAAVALGTISLVLAAEILRIGLRRQQVRRQLRPLQEGATGQAPDLIRELERETAGDKLSFHSGLLPLLRQADLSWSPMTFVVISLGVGIALLLAAIIVSNLMVLQALLFMLGLLLPYFYVRFRRNRRLRHFEEAFPESIDLLGRAIRAGHPLTSGISMVADEGPEPVAQEFQKLFEEQRFGLPFYEAMMGLIDRVDLVDVRIFVTAVLVQREVGGNLAEVLDNISSTIRDRFSIRRQLRVYTAQGRMSGYVLAAMPIVVGLGLYAMDREYMRTLFENPAGRIFLIFAFVMQIIGYLWIRKIVDIDI